MIGGDRVDSEETFLTFIYARSTIYIDTTRSVIGSQMIASDERYRRDMIIEVTLLDYILQILRGKGYIWRGLAMKKNVVECSMS